MGRGESASRKSCPRSLVGLGEPKFPAPVTKPFRERKTTPIAPDRRLRNCLRSMPLSAVTLDQLTIEDETSLASIEVYPRLKEVLRRAGHRFYLPASGESA